MISIYSYLLRVLRKFGPRLDNHQHLYYIFMGLAPTLNDLQNEKTCDFHSWYIQTQQNIASPLCFAYSDPG